MQQLLIVISTLSVSFIVALPANNNFIVEDLSYYQQIVLTNETFIGRHPCAVGSNCECFRNPDNFRQVLVECANRNLTKAHPLLSGVRVVLLQLARNAIEQMPDMTKKGYQFVKILGLSYNRIKVIPENAISKRLQMLTLEGNLITRVDQSVINKISSSKLWWFMVSRNPIICDCDSVPLVKLVQQGKKASFIIGPRLTTCADTNTPLTHLKLHELCSNVTTPSADGNANSSLLLKEGN